MHGWWRANGRVPNCARCYVAPLLSWQEAERLVFSHKRASSSVSNDVQGFKVRLPALTGPS
jgi:hypothetical protein